MKQADLGLHMRGRMDPETNATWRGIRDAFLKTGDGGAARSALGRFLETAAVDAWRSLPALAESRNCVMLAAGDFALGTLFPFSEPEIVIVREGHSSPELNEAVAAFLERLWEQGIGPRLRVGGIKECLSAREQDFEFSLSLLDRRVLAGDDRIAARLGDEYAFFLSSHGRRLGQQLAAQTRERHAKFRNTPCHREPDVRDAPGGTRDVRSIARMEKLCPDQDAPANGLAEAAAFLATVRCYLHYRAREDNNLLDLAAQQAIVDQLGGATTVPEWMRTYYRRAQAVFGRVRQAMDRCESSGGSLIGSLRELQSRLSNAEFSVVRGRVHLRGNLDPEMAVRLVEFIARHGIPPAPETERRLRQAAGALTEFCARQPQLWPALRQILMLPHAGAALRVLRNTGLIPAFLPEWTDFVGAIAAGPDHPYTVDEHAIMAIECVCALRENPEPGLQRFAELLSDGEEQPVLLFALLFHHFAEAGGHAARRLGMPPAARDMVQFLVEHHASLAAAVSGRDLDDPAVAAPLAGEIGTVERLRLLTVLTYADLATTSSEAMMPLRLDQLWRGYLAVRRELVRELETERIASLPEDLAGAVFIRGFPTRYLRSRSAAEIQAHAELYERSRPTGVAVQLERTGGAFSLTIVARDKPALFASFAGAISSFGLDIVRAEAFSNSQGIVLDTFVFTDPKRTFELNPSEAERLEDTIRRVALGRTEARRLLRGAATPPKDSGIAPQVEFDSEACPTATLVEITAADRPGLLYSLANALSLNNCNIEVVLIDTKGRRAMDVFYVTKDGVKLSPEVQASLKRQLVSACLGSNT